MRRDPLVEASIKHHGVYANDGYAGDRPSYTHEAVGRINVPAWSAALAGVETDITEARNDPEAQGRWGSEHLLAVGEKAFKSSIVDPDRLGEILSSELQPSWVLSMLDSNPDRLRDIAQLKVDGLRVAKILHELDISVCDAD